ncbi:1-aminocyclopropane-1-carboxylate deaminase [Stappia sp. 22II-S9-Z10]|nr:1-aminocyclopropane-1-carboxylate deaminase [Stappia sp. 22II-S9-Z10]
MRQIVDGTAVHVGLGLAARTEAMNIDPVYEGKSMQGLIDLTRKGFFAEGSRVSFANLGGAPALNGYGYTYRNG